jgi:hypothetical protein
VAYHHILVAYDGTSEGDAALLAAGNLATRDGARLTIVTVVALERPIRRVTRLPMLTSVWNDVLLDRARADLERADRLLDMPTTANAIGRAGRPLRPQKNPFGRGLLPRGWSGNGTVDVASMESVGRLSRPCGGVQTIGHMTQHDDPAGAPADAVVVRPARRESVSRKSTAGVWPPATAAPSPLLHPDWLSGGPSVGEVALSYLVEAVS